MPIHLRAQPDDYAPAVLVPGDPRRAKYIAETFFDPGSRCVNEERGMLGFTGTFDGARYVADGDTATRWADFGSDFYAAVSWSDVPATVASGEAAAAPAGASRSWSSTGPSRRCPGSSA